MYSRQADILNQVCFHRASRQFLKAPVLYQFRSLDTIPQLHHFHGNTPASLYILFAEYTYMLITFNIDRKLVQVPDQFVQVLPCHLREIHLNTLPLQ